MMTQRAKLRRLAFIDLPSWSRGSRPYSLDSRRQGNLEATALQFRCRGGRCQGNHIGLFSLSYRHSGSNHDAQIGVFLGWLRPEKRALGWMKPASTGSTAARRRCRDADAIIGEADQRTGQGLLQPRASLGTAFGHRFVQSRQQNFDLAEFRRSLMTKPVDGAQQQAKPDFIGHRCKGLGIEAFGG